MSDEIKNENDQENVGVDVQKYIDTINDLKSNTVSKDEYDKLKNENNTLLKSIMDGTAGASPEESSKPTAQELRNKLWGEDHEQLTDCEFLTAICDLRDVLLEEEGIDYMAPTGTQYQADYADKASAEKVYKAYRHCLEIADGDSEILHQELARITNDTVNIKNIRNRR